MRLRLIRQGFAGETMDLTDGVRVDWDDAWIHVRRSNTEPVVRIVAEAPTRQRAEELMKLTRQKLAS